MTTQIGMASVKDLILPLELHIFERGDSLFAFDVRSFTILKLNHQGVSVLSRMGRMSLDAICDDLCAEMPVNEIQAYYLRFAQLVQDGSLSSDPVPPPDRPLCHRLVLMLAGGCNMGCLYCFEKDVPSFQSPNLMTTTCADQVLDWFMNQHTGPSAHVQLYGGEPLLNWPTLVHSVLRLESWAEQSGINLTKYLITNGTLLEPRKIAWLNEHAVSIQVSVDGDAELHDRFRRLKSGRPSMDAILPSLKELIAQDANFNLRAVLCRAETDPSIVLGGLRSHGATHVSFEVVATDYEDAALNSADWEQFLASHRELLSQPWQSWSDLPTDLSNTIVRICERRRVFYGCGAGLSEVTVAPDGSIYECERMYREPIGHVADQQSVEALDRSFLTPVDERHVCQDCWARYLCGGGCMHQAFLSTGGEDPYPPFCEMKRDLAEAAIAMIHEIKSANHCLAEPETG